MPSSTGASHGKLGGRLSGGSRASTRLAKMPVVRVQGVVAPSTTPSTPAPFSAPAEAAQAAASEMIQLFEFSPGTCKKAMIVAGTAAAAAVSAYSQHLSVQRMQLSSSGSGLSANARGKLPVAAVPMPEADDDEEVEAQRPAPSLTGHARGTLVVVKPKSTYGAGTDYTFTTVCALGQKLRDGKLKMSDFDKKKVNGQLVHAVPRTTMVRWVKDDDKVMKAKGGVGIEGQPHWVVERDVRRRTALTTPGPGPVLGSAEIPLMLEFSTGAKHGWQYHEDDVADIILETLIEMEAVDPVTKQPYHERSRIDTLVKGFFQRCEARGIRFTFRGGRKLGLQRALRSSWQILDDYGKKVASPALLAFQKTHKVKLGLLDVGNFDEAQVDLCDFAQSGNFLCVDGFGNNVVVPYDQSPHFTIKWGFIGTTVRSSARCLHARARSLC